MVQDSIVDYINSQMKAGVSRDVIKTTLTGAGWVPADVEDTLKKVESAKTAQPVAAPAMPAAVAAPVQPVAAKPVAPDQQTIKVSDLVSSSSAPAIRSAAMLTSKSPLTGPAPVGGVMPAQTKPADTFFQASSYPEIKPRASRKGLIVQIVLVLIIVAVGGFAAFLFMQNGSLTSQLKSLNGQSSGVNSQLSALQSQMTASTSALTAQAASLSAENSELNAELSFLVPPPGTVLGATSTATITGTVAVGKTAFVITATNGTKVYVVNSKAANVIAALDPLAGVARATSTSMASSTGTSTPPSAPASTPTQTQFTGVYIPGSDMITLTAVNGTAL
jgi:hypothetical protein